MAWRGRKKELQLVDGTFPETYLNDFTNIVSTAVLVYSKYPEFHTTLMAIMREKLHLTLINQQCIVLLFQSVCAKILCIHLLDVKTCL